MDRYPRRDIEERAILHVRVGALRSRRGLTEGQLAQAVGVRFETIREIERGQYVPSVVLAMGIARELGVPLGEAFSLDPFALPPEDYPEPLGGQHH
jgi:putative transcriptional regulator